MSKKREYPKYPERAVTSLEYVLEFTRKGLGEWIKQGNIWYARYEGWYYTIEGNFITATVPELSYVPLGDANELLAVIEKVFKH